MKPERPWTALVFHSTLIYAAAAAATGSALTYHNSDTVLSALISLDKWTPYYWRENRFGQLIPLLTVPVRDPALNLILQNGLTVWSGLLTIWFVCRLCGRHEVLAMAAATAATVLAWKPLAQLVLLIQSNYLPPLALVLGAFVLLLQTKWSKLVRLPAFAILLWLAFWINISNVVVAGVLAALLPGIVLRARAETLTAVAVAAGGAALFARAHEVGPGFTGVLPVNAWPGHLGVLLTGAAEELVYWPVLAILCVLAVASRSRAAGALIASATAQLVLVSASEWVLKNGSGSRYVASPLLLIAATGAVTVGALANRLVAGKSAVAVAALLLLTVATRAWGLPSIPRGRALLEQRTEAAARPFRDSDCTHLIGDYWTVWMAVYHDRLTGREPARAGVSFRSDFVRELWDTQPEEKRRYCAVCSDAGVEAMRVLNQVPPLIPAGRTGETCHYRAAAGGQ